MARERAEIDAKLAAMLAGCDAWGNLAKRLQTVPGVRAFHAGRNADRPCCPSSATLSRRKIASLVGVQHPYR